MIAVLIILAIVGYPLISIVPTLLGVESRFTSLIFRAMVLGLSIVILLSVFFLSSLRIRFPVVIFFLCWIFLLLRVLNDVLIFDISPSGYFSPPDFFVFIIGVSLIPTLPLFISISRALLEKIHYILCWLVGGVVVVYSLYFSFSIDESEFIRFQSDALNAITYGSLGAIFILLTWTCNFSYKWRNNSYFFRLLAILFGGYALISSASRGPLVALVIVSLSLLFCKIRKSYLSSIGTISVIFLVLFLLLMLSILAPEISGDNFLVNRIYNFDTDSSTLERLYLIQSAWAIFISNPLVGGAIVDPITSAYPHNIFIEGLMVGGVGLGAIVLIIIAYALRLSWFYMNVCDERHYLGPFLLFCVIMAMISGSLYTGPEFWYVFAIAAASRRMSG